MSLDGDESADTDEARLGARIRRGRTLGVDAVVDDLEVPHVEAFGLREVLREPLGNRNVDVRERADGSVREAEPPSLAKLVEAVLRGEPKGDACDGPRELAVDVGVHEVRVEDAGTRAPETRGDLPERDRVDVCSQPDVVERHAPRAQGLGELPRAWLVLVKHQEAHVPAALTQVGEQLEQVRLRAGDPGDLLHVEDEPVSHEIPAASRIPRAHDCTE